MKIWEQFNKEEANRYARTAKRSNKLKTHCVDLTADQTHQKNCELEDSLIEDIQTEALGEKTKHKRDGRHGQKSNIIIQNAEKRKIMYSHRKRGEKEWDRNNI